MQTELVIITTDTDGNELDRRVIRATTEQYNLLHEVLDNIQTIKAVNKFDERLIITHSKKKD